MKKMTFRLIVAGIAVMMASAIGSGPASAAGSTAFSALQSNRYHFLEAGLTKTILDTDGTSRTTIDKSRGGAAGTLGNGSSVATTVTSDADPMAARTANASSATMPSAGTTLFGLSTPALIGAVVGTAVVVAVIVNNTKSHHDTNPVPELGSVVALGSLFVMGGVFAFRRRSSLAPVAGV